MDVLPQAVPEAVVSRLDTGHSFSRSGTQGARRLAAAVAAIKEKGLLSGKRFGQSDDRSVMFVSAPDQCRVSLPVSGVRPNALH